MAHNYLWVFGVTREGRRVLTGPFLDELEAANAEDDLEATRKYKFPTRDRSKATRMVKQKLRETGVPTDDALKRIHHEEPGDDYDDFEDSGGGDSNSFLDNAKMRLNQLSGSARKRDEPDESIFEGDPFRD